MKQYTVIRTQCRWQTSVPATSPPSLRRRIPRSAELVARDARGERSGVVCLAVRTLETYRARSARGGNVLEHDGFPAARAEDSLLAYHYFQCTCAPRSLANLAGAFGVALVGVRRRGRANLRVAGRHDRRRAGLTATGLSWSPMIAMRGQASSSPALQAAARSSRALARRADALSGRYEQGTAPRVPRVA